MQTLPNIQNTPVLAWDGATAYEIDVSNHVNFGWSFQVVTDIGTDAVFNIQAAPASDTDRCVAGTYADVEEVAVCTSPAAGALESITIPAGTKKGAICHGTIPCRSGAFLKLVAASGDTANVRACMVLSGSMRP